MAVSWTNVLESYAKVAGIWRKIDRSYVNKKYASNDVISIGDWRRFYVDEQQYTIPNSEDLILSDYLATQGAPTSIPIRLNLPFGNIIGSITDGIQALQTGDLSIYKKVILEIAGDVAGKGGRAILGASIDGGDAFKITSLISIHVMPTGRILSGGGAGGNGGYGGYGEYKIGTSTSAYVAQSYQYGFGSGVDGVYWAGVAYGVGGGQGTRIGSYYYQIWPSGSATPSGIVRYTIASGIGGSGVGGDGAGYSQPRQDGALGTRANSRIGLGGTGGNGADWGQVGGGGLGGGVGYKYTNTNSSAPTNGTAGGGGGQPGLAIDGETFSTPFLNEGTIIGTSNIIEITYDG